MANYNHFFSLDYISFPNYRLSNFVILYAAKAFFHLRISVIFVRNTELEKLFLFPFMDI